MFSNIFIYDDGTVAFTEVEQVIISPESLNYMSSPDLLELQLENATTTIMNDRWHTGEENIERVLALIKPHALYEVSTILELALWKNKMQETDDSGSRGECRVMCGSDDIIPGVLSFVTFATSHTSILIPAANHIRPLRGRERTRALRTRKATPRKRGPLQDVNNATV